MMYEEGWGVPADLPSAASWYRKAADHDYDLAQIGLGRLYLMGSGVRQDLVQAYYWLSMGAAGGTHEEHEMAVDLARDVASRMTAEELKTAKALLLAKGVDPPVQ